MRRRELLALGASAFTVTLTGAGISLAQAKPTMGVVVKIGGIPWFNAMEMGIKEKGAELGVDAIGANCGNNLADTEAALLEMRATNPDVLLVSKANAGMPECHGTELGVLARRGTRCDRRIGHIAASILRDLHQLRDGQSRV